MSNRISRLLFVFCLVMLACSQVSCGHRKVPLDNSVNAANFNSTVLQLKGYVLVLFFNGQYWQSLDMEKRFDYFSQKYRRKMRSFKFHWDVNADGSQYGLEMLPTVVLYHDGMELDRIKGIPESEKDRISWNKDIELWLLKNVLEKKGNEFTSDYVYRFNNSPRLQMSNY